MSRAERFSVFACGTEPLFEVGRKQTAEDRRRARIAPGHFRTLSLVREVTESQTKRHSAAGVHDLAKLVEKFGLAVRRKAHHLVLVSELPEAQVLGERGVEH